MTKGMSRESGELSKQRRSAAILVAMIGVAGLLGGICAAGARAQSGQAAEDKAAASKAGNAQAGISAQASETKDRWLHVRVESKKDKGESVRVNVPLEMAEKVLPAINHDRLHDGKVTINEAECNGVDIRALLEAVRSSRDGEFVTVQGRDGDVHVAKQAGELLVHVVDKKNPKQSRVEVRVPMKVVDALLSGGKDELNLVAALHALSAQGDTELVSVKDEDSTVRVWLDSKNVAD